MKRNSCTPINPKKYSCYGLKKIHTRNLTTKKYSCGSKIPLFPSKPPPPAHHNFSNDPSFTSHGNWWRYEMSAVFSGWPLSDRKILAYENFHGCFGINTDLCRQKKLYKPTILASKTSNADVLRASSRVPLTRTWGRKKRALIEGQWI